MYQRSVDITRVPSNVAIPMAPPPRTSITRAAPGAASAGMMRPEARGIYGRIPTSAAEGHEVDPWYDTRRNPPGYGAFGGLSGLDSPSEWRTSVWGVQQRLAGGGLGQAGEEQSLYARLDEIAVNVQDGIADWKRAGNASQLELGEKFAGTWALALNLLTNDIDYGTQPPSRLDHPTAVARAVRIVSNLYSAVKRWRTDAARAAGTISRETVGVVRAVTTARAPAGGVVLADLLPGVVGPGGPEEPRAFLSRWGLPLAIGLGLFFMMRR